MSRGISIYYKLINSDTSKLTYGYSGADLNKGYDEQSLLAYDGLIEISIYALEKKSVIDALRDNEVKIIKECRYEWHQPRLADGERMFGFFAIRVVSKIFREYEQNRQIASKGSIVY